MQQIQIYYEDQIQIILGVNQGFIYIISGKSAAGTNDTLAWEFIPTSTNGVFF